MSNKYNALKEQYRSEVNSEHPNMAGFSRWLFDKYQKLEDELESFKEHAKSEVKRAIKETKSYYEAENERLRELLKKSHDMSAHLQPKNAIMKYKDSTLASEIEKELKEQL